VSAEEGEAAFAAAGEAVDAAMKAISDRVRMLMIQPQGSHVVESGGVIYRSRTNAGLVQTSHR
jgi:hypothetical protein